MQEKQFLAAMGSIHYGCLEAASHQRSLLMLHGVTRRWQTFLPLMSSLATRWNVNAIDFRGHGNSDRCPDGYQVVDYVSDVVQLIESGSSQPIVLYGHSMGAMVAAATAAQLGDRVAGIVLEDPPMQTMGRRIGETSLLSFFSEMRTFAGDRRSLPEITRDLAEVRIHDPATQRTIRLGDVRDSVSLRFTATCLKQLDPGVLTPIVNGTWLDGYDTESIFQSIQCPVLLVQADISCGGMLNDEDADLIESLAGDVTHMKLKDCGHLVHWVRTSELLTSVHGFLETLP